MDILIPANFVTARSLYGYETRRRLETAGINKRGPWIAYILPLYSLCL